jgi:hypothetical protein
MGNFGKYIFYGSLLLAAPIGYFAQFAPVVRPSHTRHKHVLFLFRSKNCIICGRCTCAT